MTSVKNITHIINNITYNKDDILTKCIDGIQKYYKIESISSGWTGYFTIFLSEHVPSGSHSFTIPVNQQQIKVDQDSITSYKKIDNIYSFPTKENLTCKKSDVITNGNGGYKKKRVNKSIKKRNRKTKYRKSRRN